MTANIVVDTDTLDRASEALRGIAEDMRIGQFDSFLLEWAGIARCPHETAKAIRAFAEYAHERYRDTVAFATQLSVYLAIAAATYRLKDAALAQKMSQPLAGFLPRPTGQ